MVAFLYGCGLLGGGVGAGVRLGEAESADPLAAGELGQVLLLLGLGAVLQDGGAAEGGVGGDDDAGGSAYAAELFHGHGVEYVVGAGAAILLGYGDAHDAELGHLFYGLHREALRLVNLGCERLYFLFGELPYHLQEQVLPVCGVEIHIFIFELKVGNAAG